MKVRMESCPNCRARAFDVTLDELIDADGWVECEFCETALMPVNRQVIKKALAHVQLPASVEAAYSEHAKVELDPDIVMAIKRKYYDATNFGRADDRLSRAMSEMLIYWRESAEAEAYDRFWDGGEYSSVAHARMTAEKMIEVARKYKYGSWSTLMQRALKCCDEHQLYVLGFIGLPNPEEVLNER